MLSAPTSLEQARASSSQLPPLYLRLCLLGITIGYYRWEDYSQDSQAEVWGGKAREIAQQLQEDYLPYAPELENLPASLGYHFGWENPEWLGKLRQMIERARLIGSHHLLAGTCFTLALYCLRESPSEEADLLCEGFAVYEQWGYEFSSSLSR